VEKNITIIRSKQTIAIANAEKAKVWKEITDSVSARAGGQEKIGRVNQGKVEKSMLYANLEAAINRKSLNRTGGVSFLPVPSEATQKIIEIHTDALKTYQKRKGIVLYIFSVLSKKLICQSWIYHQWCMPPFLSFFIIQKTHDPS
jgi:hypothetical protein